MLRRARRGIDTAHADDVFLYSAALAFYGLISVVPLVVVALWITSLVVGQAQVHHVADELARLAPPALGLDRALEKVADLGTTLGLAAVVAALWPATAYGTALVRVLDRVAGDRAATGLRGEGWRCCSSAWCRCWCSAAWSRATPARPPWGTRRWRSPSASPSPSSPGFSATVATVAVVYRVFPAAPPGWKATFRGALIASGCISVLSAGYVAYLRLGANFERRYASATISAVVLLGLWLFAANTALIVGYRAARRVECRPARRPDGRAARSARCRWARRAGSGRTAVGAHGRHTRGA